MAESAGTGIFDVAALAAALPDSAQPSARPAISAAKVQPAGNRIGVTAA